MNLYMCQCKLNWYNIIWVWLNILFYYSQNSNGVVFWIDWILDDALTISTGPTAKIQISELVPWNMYCQQSVHIFRSPFPTNNPISFIFSYENGKAIFKLKN